MSKTATTSKQKLSFDYMEFSVNKQAENIKQNIKNYYFGIDTLVVDTVVNIIKKECLKQNVPLRIAVAFALRESRLNNNVPQTGGKGIYQLTSVLCKHLGLDYSRLSELNYSIYAGVFAIADIIHNEKAIALHTIIAMYGSYKRKSLPLSIVARKPYYIDFKEHLNRL